MLFEAMKCRDVGVMALTNLADVRRHVLENILRTQHSLME